MTSLSLSSRSEALRSFRMAAWLGWQVESNWTDPFLFAVYSVVKPISSAAILVVMYAIITSANFSSPIFPYIYLGNAFYIYVGAIMSGISYTIIDDREHYRTLKYMYVAPLNMPFYLLGRGVAKFLVATISVFITVTFGVLFLNVPLDLARVDWPLFFLSLLLGVGMLATMGLILAGITMMIANHHWVLGESFAGALYLFSGAIFPLDVLPPFLRPIGFLMPITYWLELVRRSLVGEVAQAFPTLAGLTNLELLGILVGLSLVFALVAILVFRRCENIAREKGLIDRVTNY